jgi:predicted DNA-binding protein
MLMAFQLKPNRKESENKTIRFPVELIDRIDKAIVNQDVTFSSFVIQACEYALNDMDTSKNQ